MLGAARPGGLGFGLAYDSRPVGATTFRCCTNLLFVLLQQKRSTFLWLFSRRSAKVNERPVWTDPHLIRPHRLNIFWMRGTKMARNNGTPIILVVEDYPDSRTLLSSLLRAKGYKVIEARDGKESLLQVNRVTPDLILMDLAMPVMDGVEATRRLRQRQVLSHTPIFAISAYTTNDVTHDALAAGCAEVFPKPLDIESLLGKIKTTLGS